MNAALNLAGRWREEATILEKRYFDPRAAELFRLHARELEEAVQDNQLEVLTIAEAAATSGFSADHIRHQVAEGKIPNVGRKGSPRVRRGDLAVKPGPSDLWTSMAAPMTSRLTLVSSGSRSSMGMARRCCVVMIGLLRLCRCR